MISVLLPIFDPNLKHLESCLRGLRDSNYEQLELIIVADLSSSYTEAMALKLLIENYRKSMRIKFNIRAGKNGISSALNLGISQSEGELIARIDCDDIPYENRFKLQVSAMKEYDSSICYGLAHNQNNKILGSELKADNEIDSFTFQNPIIHPTVMFKKKDILKIGGYNESLNFCEDLDLWLRCIQNKMKFVFVDQPIILYKVPELGRQVNNWRTNIWVRCLNWKVLGLKRFLLGVSAIGLYLFLPAKMKIKIYSFLKG
jgi:glycosyltransferase involved in cell wall biosynthesis